MTVGSRPPSPSVLPRPYWLARLPIVVAMLLALIPISAAGGSPRRAAAQSTPPRVAWAQVAEHLPVDDVITPGAFRGPSGVDVGTDGRIYVADGRASVVHVLSDTGSPLALWDGGGAFGEIRDVAVAPDRIYVTEPAANIVHVLDHQGRAQTSLSVGGRPGGIAWTGDGLVLTTESSAEIVHLAPDGTVRHRWGDGVTQPWGVDVGGDGRVYVTDLAAAGGGAIAIFDLDGVLLGYRSVTISGAPQVPLDVAVEDRTSPEIWTVTELLAVRIGTDSGVLDVLELPGGRGAAIGPGSGLVMATQDFRLGFTGLRHVRDRRALVPQIDAWGGPFAPLGTLDGPRRITLDDEGNAYVLDRWPRVQMWSDTGQPRAQWGAGSVQDIGAGLAGAAYAVDGSALKYWGDDGSLLWTWRPESTRPDFGTPFGWLTHADSDGRDVAVLDMGDQRLFVRDFSGNPLADWEVAPPDGFRPIGDIGLTSDAVWLLDRGARVLGNHDRDNGAERRRIDLPGSPRRMDTGPDGTAFVLLDSGWVLAYRPEGDLVGVWRGGPSRTVADLAAGPDGRVWLAHDDGRVTVWAADPDVDPGPMPDLSLACTIERDKTAMPAVVDLGGTVRIGLTMDGDCPLSDAEADILLLVDTSGSMSGSKMSAARSAVLEFVGQLDYSLHQVGLITFSTAVDLVQPLTSNPRSLIRNIPTLGDDAGTNMTAAVQMAGDEFGSDRARDDARQVMIILSDGRPNGDYGVLFTMGDTYRRAGVEIYTIGLGLDVDRTFMRRMANDEAHYFEAPTEYDLSQVYETIGRRASASALFRSVTVVDALPPNMSLVPDTDVPRARWDPDRRTLTWELNDVSPSGLRLRYRVRPLEAGRHPTNVRAAADYEDGVGAAGQTVFPVPEVTVHRAERWTAYLPALTNQGCPPAPIDVALVFDTSSSMRQPSGDGSKLDAAKYAGRVFMGLLNLPQDRVALVSFNNEADIVQQLTGDRGALLAALDRLPEGNGTRIDRGLHSAVDALQARHPRSIPAVVLLTDGNQADAGLAELLETAARARSGGVQLYTIGLGPDADAALLERISGGPDRTFMAPGEDQLADIYRAIAAAIPCG